MRQSPARTANLVVGRRIIRRSKFEGVISLYHKRHQAELLFRKLKGFQRIPTRSDRLADNSLAIVTLASKRPWLRL